MKRKWKITVNKSTYIHTYIKASKSSSFNLLLTVCGFLFYLLFFFCIDVCLYVCFGLSVLCFHLCFCVFQFLSLVCPRSRPRPIPTPIWAQCSHFTQSSICVELLRLAADILRANFCSVPTATHS